MGKWNKEFIGKNGVAYSKTKEGHAANMRKYRKENPDHSRKMNKTFWDKKKSQDPEAYKKYWKIYNAKRSEYRKQYILKNGDTIRLKMAKRRQETKEIRNAKNSEWRKKNPEVVRAIAHRRRAKKALVGGSFNAADVAEIFKLQRKKCAVCCKNLGKKYHLDHIVPIARGGSNYRKNIQILCPPCNHSKKDKDPIDFMQQQGFLL